MTNTLPASVASDSQRANVGELVVLFILDATLLGDTIYYFTQSRFETKAVSWNGHVFQPADCEADGFEMDGQGSMPTPSFRVSNVPDASGYRILNALVASAEDGLGAVLTRIRILRKYLDGEPSADPTAIYPLDIFSVERKKTQDDAMIEWELAAAMDQEGSMLPGRLVLRDVCGWQYRKFIIGAGFDYTDVECPYTGTAYFNALNQSVATPDLDVCSKKTSGCLLRFPRPLDLPYGGFPGVSRAGFPT